MKKNYFITLLFALYFGFTSFGQTTLAAGDIVIIEMQGDSPDGFRFVPLVDLEAGTIIRFTDNGWTGTALRSGEGTVIYTAPAGGIPKGTNIRYDVGGTTDFTTEGSDLNISSAGDQILAYQGDTATPTFIFAVAGNSTMWQTNSDDSNQTDLPQGLTDGVNAITLGSGSGPEDEFDNIYYSGVTSGTKSELLTAVATAANWTGNNSSSSPITTDFTITTTSTPNLTITSPSEGEVLAATTSVDVKIIVTGFAVAAASTGDGYIKWKINNVDQADKFDTNDETITVAAGNSYAVYMELVDNAGNVLSAPVNKTVNFSIAHPCDLILETIATTCDASTAGNDNYSGSIVFTGGNTGTTYTITAPSGVTVGGDNPNSVASGTITFSGMTEGTDAIITIVGGAGSSCNYSTTLFSPTCVSFPITEHFDYTVGSNLGDQTTWTMFNSGDEMLITAGNLDYVGLESSTGNMVSFDEIGSETYTEFSDVSTGVVYASFLLKVTGFQTGSSPDVTDGGYIASLSGSTNGYDARFWVRPNPDTSGTTFDIGFGAETSSPPFTTGTYNLNDVLFVVMAYDMDNALVSTWINPDVASFEGTIPSATLSSTDPNPPSAISLFILRQDSANETPFIELDALRISNSWADVTPKDVSASVNDNSIQGFSAYPNPVINKSFTVKTSNSSNKEITIFNVLGKKVYSTTFSGVQKTVNVATLNAGIYILKVIEEGKSSTKKLVIK